MCMLTDRVADGDSAGGEPHGPIRIYCQALQSVHLRLRSRSLPAPIGCVQVLAAPAHWDAEPVPDRV